MKHDHDDNDAPRDAHLLAALRHAPDRDAAPPPEVTARILSAARDAVRSAAAPSWAQRLAAWLKPPQLGAAFGTIAVAVLVGMMWSSREPPQPAEPVAADADAAPVAAASSEGATSGSSADAALVAQRSNDAPAPAEPQRDAAPAELAKTPHKATAAPTQAVTPAAPPAAAPRPRDGPARRVDQAPAAVAPAPPPVAEAPAFAREADAGRAAAASPPPPAPAQEAAAGARETRPMLERRAEAVAAASMPSPPVVGRLTGKADSAAANALSGSIDAPPLNGLLGNAAEDATWQVGGKSFAHGTTQRAWWAAVRAATAGRWQRDASLREAPLPTWVGVSAGGRPVATLTIDGDAVLLTEGGRNWRAPVGAAALRAWQDELSRW